METALAETFRQARWFRTDGQPACSECYDGADLELDESPQQRRTIRAGCRVYFCRPCGHRFTDCTGTPLAKSHASYRDWAVVVLGPALPPTRLQANGVRYEPQPIGLTPARYRALKARLADDPALIRRWKALLADGGITFERLVRA